MINEKYLNSSFHNYKDDEKKILNNYAELLKGSYDYPEIILYNWPRYIRHQEITRFLVFYEIFKKIKDVHGSFAIMGCLDGNTLFSFAHFSEIFEPRNYSRKIYGFDTFNARAENSADYKIDAKLPKGTRSQPFSEKILRQHVDLFNKSCLFNQFEKIKIVKGDIVKILPAYLKKNPGLIISMLSLSISLYKPEITALKLLWPRMPKGGIVHLVSLGYEETPSATKTIQDVLGIGNVKIQRFDFATKHSYIIKE